MLSGHRSDHILSKDVCTHRSGFCPNIVQIALLGAFKVV